MPKNDVERINKVLPNNVDTVRLATDFDSIASKYGISIKNIQSIESKNSNSSTIIQSDGKAYNAVDVNFSFVASYDNFRNFMQDIEKSLRIIDIESVSFDQGDSGLSEYRVSIKTYWLK